MPRGITRRGALRHIRHRVIVRHHEYYCFKVTHRDGSADPMAPAFLLCSCFVMKLPSQNLCSYPLVEVFHFVDTISLYYFLSRYIAGKHFRR